MCCTWLGENTGRKYEAKNRHLGTIPQLCQAISSQIRHVSTIGKKLVKQQYLFHMSPQYCELRPTSGRDRFGSLGHPSYFQRLPHLVEYSTCSIRSGNLVANYLRRITRLPVLCIVVFRSGEPAQPQPGEKDPPKDWRTSLSSNWPVE